MVRDCPYDFVVLVPAGGAAPDRQAGPGHRLRGRLPWIRRKDDSSQPQRGGGGRTQSGLRPPTRTAWSVSIGSYRRRQGESIQLAPTGRAGGDQLMSADPAGRGAWWFLRQRERR